MEKVCMFSMVLLWSLAGSVRGCWARAAVVISRTRTPTRKFRVSSFKFRENHVFATWEFVGQLGVPPPPPLVIVFMELRTVSAQSLERVGVIWILLRNKDLAKNMTA